MARRKTTPARYPLIAFILLLLASGLPSLASAQSYTISPPPFLLAQTNAGAIINNACIWTYVAGTTTAATTYSDNTGTQNTNPIRSDSAGRFTAFLVPGNSYKYVYESACVPPAHGTTLRTADNIQAMPPSGVNVDLTGTAGETINAGAPAYISDGSGSKTVGQWYNASATDPYSSSTATIVGIAVSSVTSGNSGTFRIAGRATGLAGLSTGSNYYPATAAGTLTSTQPTNARLIGIADSTTTLVVLSPKSTTTQPLGMAEGRLTATTGNPCCADASAATSIFYTPYIGNRIALYDGSASWNVKTFTEITISVTTCTASKPYDVFIYDNAGTVAAETLVWTNGTTRATALARQDGVYVKSGTTTRRYVGTFYCNASGGQTDDSLAKRFLWNYYNRVRRELFVTDTADSWNYTIATWRQARASTANQVETIVGVAEGGINLQVMAGFSNSSAGVGAAVAIGIGSTSAVGAGVLETRQTSPVANYYVSAHAVYAAVPAVGYMNWVWLEDSEATGTTTWYGDNGGQDLGPRAGLIGTIEG